MPRSILIAALSITLWSLAAMPAIGERAVSTQRGAEEQATGLDAEIDALSRDLRAEKDLTVTIDRLFLDYFTDQLAKASPHDLRIKIFPSRLLTSHSDLGFAKYQNYLDLEGGEGTIDLREASIEGIKNGRIHVLLDMAGLVKAQARGEEIGFKYNANPDIRVSLHDRVAFVIEPEGGEFRLRPVAKQLVAHLDIGVLIAALGTRLHTTQDMPVDVAKFLKPIALPHVISTSFHLPGSSRPITLTNTGYRAEEDKLQLSGDLSFGPDQPQSKPAVSSVAK